MNPVSLPKPGAQKSRLFALAAGVAALLALAGLSRPVLFPAEANTIGSRPKSVLMPEGGPSAVVRPWTAWLVLPRLRDPRDMHEYLASVRRSDAASELDSSYTALRTALSSAEYPAYSDVVAMRLQDGVLQLGAGDSGRTFFIPLHLVTAVEELPYAEDPAGTNRAVRVTCGGVMPGIVEGERRFTGHHPDYFYAHAGWHRSLVIHLGSPEHGTLVGDALRKLVSAEPAVNAARHHHTESEQTRYIPAPPPSASLRSEASTDLPAWRRVDAKPR